MKNFIIFIILLLFYSITLNNKIQSITQNIKNDIQTINIGFASSLFPEIEFRDAKAAIESWSKELIKDGYLEYIFSASILKSNDEIKEAFQQNKISIVALHALDYLYIKKEANIIPLLIPSTNKDVTENYIILTNKRSNIQSISQLKNKKIAIQKGSSNVVPYIWFENLMMMKESNNIEDLCSILDLKKDSRAIFSLFFNQIDACVVSSKVYYSMCRQNKQLLNDLVIINTSPKYLRDIFCISQNMEKKYIGDLLDATISIQNYDSGKKIMNLFQFERFIIFEDKYIESLENLLKENQNFKKKLKSKNNYYSKSF